MLGSLPGKPPGRRAGARGAARRFWFLVAAVGLPHCGGGGAPAASSPSQPEWIVAPPRPGSSITHTKLCECTSCNPARCCGGETEESEAKSCGDSYDFSAEGCSMTVSSCTSRCTKHVWRVPLAASCEDSPKVCCFAGVEANASEG